MTFTWIDGAIPKPYRFTGWLRKDEQTKLSLGVHTPHGGWWGSHLVQGRVRAFLRLRSQSLGKATRPREQDCGEAAGCLQGKRRLPRLDWHGRYRDGINSSWPGFASSMGQDSRGPGATGQEPQAIETQYPVLPPIKYIQRSTWIWPPSLRVGGPGLGARTPAPPQFLSESSPMGSCLRVSDFRLYCYFLKKQKRKHTLLF